MKQGVHLALILALLATPAWSARLKLSNLTAADRAAWRKVLRWPDDGGEQFYKGTDAGLAFYKLAPHRYLAEVEVSRAAYQAVYVFYTVDPDASPIRSRLLKFPWVGPHGRWQGQPSTELVGIPEVDTRKMQLSLFSKGRGLADIGSNTVWSLRGINPVLLTCHAWDDAEHGRPPDQWPQVYPRKR